MLKFLPAFITSVCFLQIISIFKEGKSGKIIRYLFQKKPGRPKPMQPNLICKSKNLPAKRSIGLPGHTVFTAQKIDVKHNQND